MNKQETDKKTCKQCGATSESKGWSARTFNIKDDWCDICAEDFYADINEVKEARNG